MSHAQFPTPDPPSRRSALVLILEDDPSVRESLEFVLQIDGFRTRAFGSGAELLAQPDLLEVACLVLDHRLPGLTGVEVLSGLRQRGIATPAVFVTARADLQMREHATRLGAIAILEKPLSQDLLSQAIRESMHSFELL